MIIRFRAIATVTMIHRRDLLKSTLLLSTLCAPGAAQLAAAAARSSPRSPPSPANVAFDYATLKGHARALASSVYRPPTGLAPESLVRLDYDQYQSIRYRRDRALWGKEERGFRIEFFHMGRGFKEPVRMFEVVEGKASEIRYRPDLFDLSTSGVSPRTLPSDLGFAGFRVHHATDWEADVAAFLGASYFRAVGSDTRQFGLSARGLAVDTAAPHAEEFPRFTSYWFERPPPHARHLIVYGLMDSPSVTGAYRFELAPGAPHVVDIDAALYPRKSVERFGAATLTSMYQCGENDRRMGNDWRPEIHDSDGLSILSGSGEWIWRPLVNPTAVRLNSFLDNNPRGFGLLQRDRAFGNYQDDGVHYDRRPSVWIEPRGNWGAGSIQLVEIPTVDETFDNIVAFWNPASPPQPGDEVLFSYRMHWGTQIPVLSPLAQAVATRNGIGGVIGQKRRYFSWRFAVDFAGGELAGLPLSAEVDCVVTASRGHTEITSARPLQPLRGYRAMFDIRPLDDSIEPIDLRLFLRRNGQPLSETWIYQWTPPAPAERRLLLAQAGA